MSPFEMKNQFLVMTGLINDPLSQPATIDLENWFNEALIKFVKTRYSGINAKQKGFEQNEKRIDDLRYLVKHVIKNSMTEWEHLENAWYTTPIDSNGYLFILSQVVYITPTDINDKCWPKDSDGNFIPKPVSVKETTLEDLPNMLSNPLSDHILTYGTATPLCIREGKTPDLVYITDGTYKVVKIFVTYLGIPSPIQFIVKADGEQPIDNMVEYEDLPEYTHNEIVQLAIELYMAQTNDTRYQQQSIITSTME